MISIILVKSKPAKEKKDAYHILSSAAGTGFVVVLLATTLNTLLQNGYTGNAWGDALYDMLSQNIDVQLLKTFLSELFVEMPGNNGGEEFFITLMKGEANAGGALAGLN